MAAAQNDASLSNWNGTFDPQRIEIKIEASATSCEQAVSTPVVVGTSVSPGVPSSGSSATSITKVMPAVTSDARGGSETALASQEELFAERGTLGATPGTISDDGISNALFTQLALDDRLCLNSREEMKDLHNRQIELERRFVELECQFQGLAEESLSRLGHIDLLNSVGIVERLGAIEMREKKLVAYVNKALTNIAGSRSQTPLQPKSGSPVRHTPTSAGESTQDVGDLAAKIREQDDALLLLQDQFEEMQTWCVNLSKKLDKDGKENGKVSDLSAWSADTHTKSDFTELRRQVSTLQDEVNQRLFDLSRQVLETGQRTQTLNSQCQEFCAKVESHEVSFNTTLSRLEATDTQVSFLANSIEDLMTSGAKPTIMGPGTCTSLLAFQAEAIDAQKEAIDVLQRQMGIQPMSSSEDEKALPQHAPHLFASDVQNRDDVEAVQCRDFPTLQAERIQHREDLLIGQNTSTLVMKSDRLPCALTECVRESLKGLDREAEFLRSATSQNGLDLPTSSSARGSETSPPQARVRVASPVTMKPIRSPSPMPTSGLDSQDNAASNRRLSGNAQRVAPSLESTIEQTGGSTLRNVSIERSIGSPPRNSLAPFPTQTSFDTRDGRRVAYSADIPTIGQEIGAGTTRNVVAAYEPQTMKDPSGSHSELNFDDLELTVRRLREKWGVNPSEIA